jgi:hypothetical protein
MNLNLSQRLFFLILASIFILSGKVSLAQVESKDFKDVTNKWRDITDTLTKNELVVGKSYLSILPVVGYAPANGFLAGGAISFSRLFGKPPTNLSSGMLNFQVTSKRQMIANARSKIYLSGNKWFLQGDWRLLFFTQPTYGLGINNSEFNKMHIYTNNLDLVGDDTLAEPMQFKLIRVYEEVSRRLGNSHVYAGLGIAVDQHFDIKDERLDTIQGSPEYFVTNHYAYSVNNNYNPAHYGINGIKLTILTDTRDNISNCYKGYYASISLLSNIKIGSNSQQSLQLLYDARYYLGVSNKNPRHLVAFWSYGSVLLNGNVPYLALPSIGWDTYNRSGRGFIQGRYRGLSMIYNEVEYRFPISKNGLFGGVLFVNATTGSNYYKKLFDKTAFGRGAGVRMQLDKRARTNLTIDIGLGADRATAIYFNLQEVF